jgi:hypothetical protein
MGLNAERVHSGPKLRFEKRVNEAVPRDGIFSLELAGHDHHLEVGLASGRDGVAGAFVLDRQVNGGEGRLKFLFDLGVDGHWALPLTQRPNLARPSPKETFFFCRYPNEYMSKAFKFHLLLLLSLAAAGARAENSNYRSKVGFDFKALRTLDNADVGWLAGLRFSRFLGKSNVHVGFGGSFGTPTGGNPSQENLFNVGVSVGYDGKYGRVGVWELGLFAGYGQGKLSGATQTSYYVVEPSFGSGFALGLGWRVLFTASYLHMSRTSNFSGFSLGIRLDRRYDTTVKPVDP